MLKRRFLWCFLVLFTLSSCSKEEFHKVLQTNYSVEVQGAEPATEEFVVSLNARALQPNERGEWRIINGPMVEDFVFFTDHKNPYTKFKGLPGQEYTLEWRRWIVGGKEEAIQTKIKIPELSLNIKEEHTAGFNTISTLSVNARYPGTWSFDKPYARIVSYVNDGVAGPPENKPSLEIHGYANTTYTATYKCMYANVVYEFKKVFQTGDYTQEEGLSELRLSSSDRHVTLDNRGNVLEIDMQSSSMAYVFGDGTHYPAISAFKKLRKLNLDYSSLTRVSDVFGAYYPDLEYLSMLRTLNTTTIPENFGDLTKLNFFRISSDRWIFGGTELILPKSFMKLTSLQTLSFDEVGYVNFNGTLGGLTALEKLDGLFTQLPEDVGNLKNLKYLDLKSRDSFFPARISACKSLTYLRLTYESSGTQNIALPGDFGNLKQLEEFHITTDRLRNLPNSFVNLTSLHTMTISGSGLESIPDNFGALPNLESLTLYGKFTRIPDSFGNLEKLKYLNIAADAESLPESFGNLSSLIYLNIEHAAFKTFPESIGKLKKLTEINARFCKIQSLPQSFGNLDALEVLNLSNTGLNTFPREIIPLKNVRSVLLLNTKTGDIPDEISKMRTGVRFELLGVENLTLEHLQHILSVSKGKVYNTNLGFFFS
jgi:Leucine-rich repeat (LRR) protein